MFNIENKGNLTGEYPLFFGEDLGLSDAFIVPYPQLKEIDREQRKLFWPADEMSYHQDAQDLLEADDSISELMIRNLSFQMAGDSIANGSISQLFLPIITNTQAKAVVNYWNLCEDIHDEAYSRIIAQCFPDPNKMIERIKKDEKLIRRLQPILDCFKDHMEMLRKIANGEELELSEKRKTTIKTIVALLCLEGIMFLASFASTFAICESTQRFNAIAKTVGMIHDDEAGAHVKNNLTFLDIIINIEKWEEWEDVKQEVKMFMDLSMQSEFLWADEAFEGIGSIVGFNSALLKQYTCYIAKPYYDTLRLPYTFEVVDSNPLPWIDSYIDPNLLQVANQEAQNANYVVNSSIDDVDEQEFDYSY